MSSIKVCHDYAICIFSVPFLFLLSLASSTKSSRGRKPSKSCPVSGGVAFCKLYKLLNVHRGWLLEKDIYNPARRRCG